MADLQKNKEIVRQFHREIDAAGVDDLARVIEKYTLPEYFWRGMHPFYEQTGATAVAGIFWAPLHDSFSPVQRRQDVFMAGISDEGEIGAEWVCSMGHLMGLFDRPWLGIPPTGKMIFLRYAEFSLIVDGKIAETALFCDILSVMQQAGLNPLPLQTGASLVTPGPQTHDGLMFEAQDPEESEKTLALINRMIADLVGSGLESPADELARTWHDDMIWWGPGGIGATYTRPRYQEQHQGPFGEGLEDIRFTGHLCRIAEGNFGGFFGWPNLTMKPSGGFLGLPASDRTVGMRVVDIYRRDGDKLAENWIFIDILHFLAQQDLDILGRMRRISRS